MAASAGDKLNRAAGGFLAAADDATLHEPDHSIRFWHLTAHMERYYRARA
nr:hypothetical protein [uncultured Rhodopila sp.]